ncbi:Hypothetical protein R9X50_00147100 [Acrodontium crateriforme]|uniref:Copper homeostasis protein cutC homolog n=1 Tax=Acrodontium crateriforme TaxID=150365 RepID=A0AAQ3R5V2_9PEZI|nr:Hypothetical protein R9X50_00147100 [Acrodontium crateriforme]
MSFLEIACFSPDSAIIASNAGADRIELCDDSDAGGTTPPLQWLTQIKPHVQIPIFVMIRPRGGDFAYSDHEFHQMKSSIDVFKARADGFVFGILNGNRTVDVKRTAELVQRAHPLPCTFHRAFDDAVDPLEAYESVLSTGCKAILSSGGAPSAAQGTKVLCNLVNQAKKSINVIPGGGVRAENIALIKASTGASIFHSSAMRAGTSRPSTAEIQRMKDLIR